MYNDDAAANRNFEINVINTSSFGYEVLSAGSTDPRWFAIGF